MKKTLKIDVSDRTFSDVEQIDRFFGRMYNYSYKVLPEKTLLVAEPL